MIRLRRISFPNAFPLVLDSNLHDLNETNLGLTLYSTELPWCCFCVEIKVLEMERNFVRIFLSIIRISGAKTCRRGAPGWAQPTRAFPPLLARPGGLYPPGGPVDNPPDTIKSHYSRKETWRKNYHDPRDGAAAKPCSSSGGQIWSPFGAPERGIFILRHHQPISIANSMMLPIGSE